MEVKKTRPIRTVAVMMAVTVLSKGMGVLRSMLMASHYGTGMAANAFSEALHIPLTFFDLLFSAAIVGCFVPVYNSFHRDEEKKADEFACIFLNAILLLCGLLALLGIALADPIIGLMAPGFDGETHALAVKLLRMLFPIVLFTAGTYTLVGLMQSKGRYFLPSMVSAVSNGFVILYFLLFDPGVSDQRGIYMLAAAYLAAWLLQFLTLVVPLRCGGFRFRFLLDFKNPALRRALKMTPPIILGSWLTPAGLLIGMGFASTVQDVRGAVTVFDYTNNVYTIIAGIVTYSICNYVFPILSREACSDDTAQFIRTVQSGLRSAFMLVVPVLIGTLVLSGEGISILYQRNEFTAQDAAVTASALRWMAWAMAAFACVELLSRVCYACGAVRIPMTAALCGVAVNVICSALAVFVFHASVNGIALANAAGQLAAATVMTVALSRRLPRLFDRELLRSLCRIVLCGLLSAIVMIGLHILIGRDPFASGLLSNVMVTAVVFVSGTAVYLAAARLLRIPFREKV